MIIITNVGDLYPLKNQLIICFEHHCYEFYAVNLGLQSLLSVDNSNEANDNEYDNSNIKSEEITKYDSNTTDCSIYYFSGYVLRAMMGILSRGFHNYTSDELKEIQRNIFNSFCVTSSMAEADGLPIDIVHDRCTTKYENLLYVNNHFFDNLLQLEKDVISRILDDTRLLIFLGAKVCHYIEKKTLCHESYNNLLEMIDESLSSCDFLITEDKNSGLAKILCDKFFAVYLNIAYNDLVLSALPRKMKNNSDSNVPFRLQIQLKKEGEKK
jgi:hypothetical protein